MKYPFFDFAWIATDCHNRVAAFITGGKGPIPESILGMHGDPIAVIEKLMLKLPILGSGSMLRRYPKEDSFMDLANRGLFVYDWTDVHKTNVDKSSAYELVCIPSSKITGDDLSMDLQKVASEIGVLDLEFSQTQFLDPCQYVQCKVSG